MRRRRGSQDDPTAHRALVFASIESTEVMPELEKLLHDLGPVETGVMTRRWGLHDGQPKTLHEIGVEFGVTRERIRQIERKCLDKIQDQIKNSPLAVVDGGQVVGLVDILRAGTNLPSLDSRDNPVWCPQCHQRKFLPSGEPLVGGRRRKYCSNACRQAAYRARRDAGGEEQSL